MSVSLTKTTTSINVTPGTPIQFIVTIGSNNPLFNYTVFSFNDPLPALPSGSPWVITNPSQFSIVGPVGSQELIFRTVTQTGISTAIITANTTLSDAGAILPNSITAVVSDAAGNPITITASATASIAICIHGSSKIKLSDKEDIEISKIQPCQEIIGADGLITTVVEAVPCWAGVNNESFGTCIIFEKDSLGPGVPYEILAIDAGHPISTPQEYRDKKQQSLKPAKSYLNPEKGIYSITWDKVESLLPGENKRYDLIMDDSSCKAYIANGIVVQARMNRTNPGYVYE